MRLALQHASDTGAELVEQQAGFLASSPGGRWVVLWRESDELTEQWALVALRTETVWYYGKTEDDLVPAGAVYVRLYKFF